jgi:hypothetical protein
MNDPARSAASSLFHDRMLTRKNASETGDLQRLSETYRVRFRFLLSNGCVEGLAFE